MQILCPVCALPLARDQTPWRCTSGHSFDVARQGYVNLLPVQQKHSLHPGDTKEQVLAREGGVNGEGVTVGSSDGDLLTHLSAVEPIGDASALLYGKLHILGICGG